MSHMKRITVPRTWPLPRKTHKWAIRPTLGPHPVERSVPLLVLVRDYLRHADTAAEARKIISARTVMVDGVVRTDPKFPCGLMDVLSIPSVKEHYRVLVDSRGFLRVVPIAAKEAQWKLCRVENKSTVKGGKIQLNLHDGRNILSDGNHKTGDVLKISVPGQEILEAFPFQTGAVALVTEGKHAGHISTIKGMETARSSRPDVIHLEGFSTIKPYVFPVGKEKAVIKPPEVAVYG
ncbi:MAG: 30S ribosomal protein S4e [Thermoplasmatota archaeon]